MLSRRKFLRRAGAAAALSPLLPSLAAGAPGTAADGTFTALRRGVGTYTERGGTIGWLARGGRLVVVDTQYPESARACWSGLTDRAGSDDLALLINTHHHGDHTGGNGVFKPKAEASVAHANAPELQKASARESGSLDEQAYAEATFEETWSESVGDETVTLRHFGPAHTGGDAVVFFEEANVVHMGDLVFNRAYPFIDVGGGADSRNWIAALETVHESLDDDTICVHGHGNPEYGVTGSREDLLVMRDFLSALNEYVARQRQQGAALEEMKSVDGLDGFESFQFDWALSLADCIEAVHREQTS